jgi:hypothetical protein
MINECGAVGGMKIDEGKIQFSGGKVPQCHYDYICHKSQAN